jgi:hypothetical protein
VSDGFGGYQVSEPAAGVPFLPRLPEPAPRVAPAAPNPLLPGGPTLPGAAAPSAQPAGAAAAVATMERRGPTGPPMPGELPEAPAAPERPPRRTPMEALGAFWRALPVIILAVVIGGGSIIAANNALGPATLGDTASASGSNDGGPQGSGDALPLFSTPTPVFGTATYHTTVEGGVDARVTFNADGSQVWYEFFPWSTETPSSSILANSGATFVRRPDVGWVLVDVTGSSQLASELLPLRMFTFEDYVPNAFRPYVQVEAQRSLVLSGRTVEEYTLNFDLTAMSAAHGGLTNDWQYRLGMSPGGTYARLIVSVDSTGLVWKVVSDNPAGGDVSWSLEYLGPEPFTVQFPTTYFNKVTGQQVNG